MELTILFDDELMAEAENQKWQKYCDLVEIESQGFDVTLLTIEVALRGSLSYSLETFIKDWTTCRKVQSSAFLEAICKVIYPPMPFGQGEITTHGLRHYIYYGLALNHLK